ncbi:MAG: hypothetical protein KDA61_16710 [Planctomycetales bacterium]|nr:hypothetical protein [Planctomycetales bacterium]
MSTTIDLLEAFESDDSTLELSLIRLGENETAVVPFTAQATQVDLHYCDEPELRGYVRCNGLDCTLCRLGKAIAQRSLLPVYLPLTGAIGVVAISPVRSPKSLLSQLHPYLRAEQAQVLFVTRKGHEYRVEGRPLQEGQPDGAAAIAAFQERVESGAISLEEVYPTYSNEDLLAIDSIQRLAELKGVAA